MIDTMTLAEAQAIINKERVFEDGEKYVASTLKNQNPKVGSVFFYCEFHRKEVTDSGKTTMISIRKAKIV